MTVKDGGNRTTNDETLTAATTLNSTTAVKIADANPARHVFYFSNPTNKDMVLKLQAATVDNLPIGILVLRGTRERLSESDGADYIGEISGMTLSGTGDIWTVEY